MKILGVIPARGGSKGVPRKNIRSLRGKPLIDYTIQAALESQLLTNFVVSTEDEEIAKVCQESGAPILVRPPELAEDTTLSLPVVQHAVTELETQSDQQFDIITLLQPTTPLRLATDIDKGIQLLLDTEADSVVSVVNVKGHHPFRMKRIVRDNILMNYIDQGFEDMRPRQQLPPVFIRSGALYISHRNIVMEQNMLVGSDCRALIIPEERAVNIDTEIDLILAEHLLTLQKSQT